MKEFCFGNFSLYRIFRKIDQFLLLNVCYKPFSKKKKVEILNNFFIYISFTIGFTKTLKRFIIMTKWTIYKKSSHLYYLLKN